jgi:3-deoxy-D-manno-octulosonic-acid transferase
MNRLVGVIRPDLFILVKYDFWPDMLRALHRHGVPCCLVSARFRPGQFMLTPVGSFILRELRPFRQIFVQDDVSVGLLQGRGFQQVIKAGDTRVDAVMEDSGRRTAAGVKKTMDGGMVVAGSSWQAEERMLARYWCGEERGKFLADWRLVIAPHEIGKGRLESIERLFGPEVVRYSEWERSGQKDWDILLIDRIGLLKGLYFGASVAVIGGGFGRGIHNILEPAAAGIPILFGPKYQKFGEAADLIEVGAAFPFKEYDDFEQKLDHLLLNREKCAQAGLLALNYLQKSAGSTALIIKYLLQILPEMRAKNGY